MSQPDTEAQLQAVLRMLSELDQASDVPRCVALCRQALTLISRDQDPTLWAELQSKLGNSLIQTPQGERADNLERAIHHYEQALEVYTREAFPKNWARTQNGLAIAYANRIRGARADNLERAIHHYEQALEVYTREAFPKNWARTQNNLAIAYERRVRGRRADNLERAVRHCGQALQVYTRKAFPKNWAQTQLTLGIVYADRIRGKRADNLEQAIRHYQQALQVYTRKAFPEQWAATQHNLANAYTNRIRGERADNLERAIHHFEQALEVRTREAFPEDWAATQNELAVACEGRIRDARADNLEEAIRHYQQALEVYTHKAFPERWAHTQNNLAIAYVKRIRGAGAKNLEQAIHYYRQALEIYSRKAFPEQWADIQNNLGNAYANRIRGERADNLERAIHYFERALKVYTCEAFPENWARTQNNLAVAYERRIRGERADNLDQAIRHYEQALEVLSCEALPFEYIRTQGNLSDLHFAQEDWERAHTNYTAVIKAGVELVADAYTEVGRRAEVGTTAQLYANDAFALVHLGQPRDALLRLEQGKTRLLNETLALSEIDLAMLPDTDQQALRAARQAVRELEAEMRLPADGSARRNRRELAEALRQARDALNRLIKTIRADQPGFMPVGLDLPALLALIPEGGALVAPLFTTKGGAVFVVPHGRNAINKDDILHLDRFADADLRALLTGPADEPELGGWLGAYGDQEVDPPRWFDAIETIGQVLWDRLMGPMHQRLSTLGLAEGAPLLLMPQGGLGLLPVHAAWRAVNGKKRYFLDDYTVSYVPSGYALGTSCRRLGEPSRGHRSLLAVVNPTRDLPFTPAEGRVVTALFSGSKPLEEDQATGKAVIAAAPKCSYLHFACHGRYSWEDAMQSSLVLADRQMTLAEIISKLDLSAARLVTLSACETGMTDIRQSPDEYLGLPAGFLQAGAPTVVSTLWPVEDLSTMLLMERFYRGHLQEGLPPAVALRRSQLWLRDATAGDMGLAGHWEQVYLTTADPGVVRTAFRSMRYYANHPEDRPFSSPYYWAPFTFAGV